MPFLFVYMLKLSVSLAVVFMFYHFVLRKLTFYNWNRWYLLGYTLLSFVIPFINITRVLDKNNWSHTAAINWLPVIGTNTRTSLPVKTGSSFSGWDIAIIFLVTGMVVMLMRLLIQLFSFWRLRNKATVITTDGMKLYQVDENIIPFSFGNSIFINRHLHNEKELEEIIRHEFVHVKQKHSVDIIVSELLCLFCWYNPFAWLLKIFIRRNLEFIADNKVLENGINKKEYQYLLLKVVGNKQFSIVTTFNFSSLKKRIAMMNKMQSAKKHLIKFLFVLPLVAGMLVAFRGKMNSNNEDTDNAITMTGIIYDAKTLEPIPNVSLIEVYSGINVKTDEKGFYKFKLPIQIGAVKMQFKCDAENYEQRKQSLSYNFSSIEKTVGVQLISMRNKSDKSKIDIILSSDIGRIDYPKYGSLYNVVAEKFRKHIDNLNTEYKLNTILKQSNEPIVIMDGLVFAVDGFGSKAWFSKDEYSSLSDIKVSVDGMIMSIEDANKKINRKEVKGIAAIDKKTAKKYFDIDNVVLGLSINIPFDEKMFVQDITPATSLPSSRTDTIPDVTEQNNKGYIINVKDKKGECLLVIKDKTGKEVKRMLLTEWNDNAEKYEALYGEIPPPPPPVPAKAPAPPKAPVSATEAIAPVAPIAPASATAPVPPIPPIPSTAPIKSEQLNSVVVELKKNEKSVDASLEGPGNPGTVYIRNTIDIKGSTDNPLYVVDGVVESPKVINTLDPQTIQSINVLKGQSATALYGEKGKNGIIIITTKSAVNVKAKPVQL